MARRYNDLFIGADKLNIEGREIKHIGLIKQFSTVNLNKISDTPLQLIGLDLETDPNSAELMLLGFWDGKKYSKYDKFDNVNFLSILFNWIKYCDKQGYSLAYWNRLDPFILFKQFLNLLTHEQRITSLLKFSKVGGEWDENDSKWIIHPVCEIKVGDYYFGILNAIRSSVQFYYRRENDNKIKKIWAYDIAQLYQNGLEKEATKRFKYYTKIDKSVHIVNWERYQNDKQFKDLVLKSNMLDARAVTDLGNEIQYDFHATFGYYPRNLISQGALARSAILATLHNLHNGDVKKIVDDINAIGIENYIDEWADKFGKELIKDLLCITFESYYGGLIETYGYGYAKKAYMADLVQAYPSEVKELWDLRGAKITNGKGIPPNINYSYCFIRGDVKIPLDVDFHSLTIKHPIHKETNIRAVGEFRTTYNIEERDYHISLCCTFDNEEWINIETLGVLSPLALVTNQLVELREKLRPLQKDYIAKSTSASVYGLTIEATDTYIEKEIVKTIDLSYNDTFYKDILKKFLKSINLTDIKTHLEKSVYNRWNNSESLVYADTLLNDLEKYGIYIHETHPIDIINEIDKLYRQKTKVKEYVKENIFDVVRDGYRGGEFLNPIFASYITARTRLKIAKASNSIKQKGGTPILVMTDSVFWEGSENMLPEDVYREIKTVGYFEKPNLINDLVCLGAGRYGYITEDGYQQAKRRGLNATEIHDPEGIIVGDFNWLNALKILERTKQEKIQIIVRVLISVGMVLHNKHITQLINGVSIETPISWKDIGRVVEVVREVDVIAGKAKRIYDDEIENVNLLASKIVVTSPIHITRGLFGKNNIEDHTLATLRELTMEKDFKTTKEKKRITNKKSVKNYHDENKSKITAFRKHNYHLLKEYGYDTKERVKMQGWSMEKIQQKLMEDGKL